MFLDDNCCGKNHCLLNTSKDGGLVRFTDPKNHPTTHSTGLKGLDLDAIDFRKFWPMHHQMMLITEALLCKRIAQTNFVAEKLTAGGPYGVGLRINRTLSILGTWPAKC